MCIKSKFKTTFLTKYTMHFLRAELNTKEELDSVFEEKYLDEKNLTPADEIIDVIDSAKSSTRERQDESREDLHVKELTGSGESRFSKLQQLYL